MQGFRWRGCSISCDNFSETNCLASSKLLNKEVERVGYKNCLQWKRWQNLNEFLWLILHARLWCMARRTRSSRWTRRWARRRWLALLKWFFQLSRSDILARILSCLIFTTNKCEKVSSSLWRWDSNPQSFVSPITTRPGLLPYQRVQDQGPLL